MILKVLGALVAPHVAHADDPLRDRPEPGFDVIPAVLEPADVCTARCLTWVPGNERNLREV